MGQSFGRRWGALSGVPEVRAAHRGPTPDVETTAEVDQRTREILRHPRSGVGIGNVAQEPCMSVARPATMLRARATALCVVARASPRGVRKLIAPRSSRPRG